MKPKSHPRHESPRVSKPITNPCSQIPPPTTKTTPIPKPSLKTPLQPRALFLAITVAVIAASGALIGASLPSPITTIKNLTGFSETKFPKEMAEKKVGGEVGVQERLLGLEARRRELVRVREGVVGKLGDVREGRERRRREEQGEGERGKGASA